MEDGVQRMQLPELLSTHKHKLASFSSRQQYKYQSGRQAALSFAVLSSKRKQRK